MVFGFRPVYGTFVFIKEWVEEIWFIPDQGVEVVCGCAIKGG